jgi:hypothetical protein
MSRKIALAAAATIIAAMFGATAYATSGTAPG